MGSWLLVAACVRAQEPAPLDEALFEDIPVVYGAAKHEQRVTDAPAMVTILTHDDIERFGWRNLNDALVSIVGIITNTDRNYVYTGVRGFSRPGDYGERVLLLIDGFRMNEPIYDAAAIDELGPIQVQDIDRIEVIRGPGSALYGTNAMLAVINVITRRGRDVDGAEIAAGGGAFGTARARVTAGGRLGGDWEFYLGTGFTWSEGQDFTFPRFEASGDALVEDMDGSEDLDALLKVVRNDTTLQGYCGTYRKDIPSAPYGTRFDEPGTETRDTHCGVGATVDRAGADGTDVYAALRAQWYAYEGTYAYGYGLNRDLATAPFGTLEARVAREWLPSNRITTGLEARAARVAQLNYDLAPGGRANPYNDAVTAGLWGGVFAQDEIDVAEWLDLVAGARVDVYPGLPVSVNPRGAVVLRPTETTTAKLLYGKAFRAPNPYETEYELAGYWLRATDDLGPETVHTFEVVLEQTLAEGLHASAAGFHYRFRDLVALETTPGGLLQLQNSERVQGTGVDSVVELRRPWLDGWVGYGWVRTHEDATDDPLDNAPEHSGRLALSPAVVPDRLYLGGEVQAESARTTLDDAETGGFVVLNASVQVRDTPVDGLGLRAQMRNVLDTEILAPARPEHRMDVIPQDGRSWFVQLSYAF